MFIYSYGNRKFILKPFTTKIQKDISLLSETITDYTEETLDIVIDMMNINFNNIDYSTFTFDEKLALLYKMREISVSEIVNLEVTCSQCNTKQLFDVDIRDIIKKPLVNDDTIIDNYKEFNEDDIHDYVNIDVEELELDQYDNLINTVKDSICKFDFKRKVICGKCRREILINLRDPKLCIRSLVNESFKSLYQTYNDIIYYSHYTKQDIDSMYPFERDIFKYMLFDTLKNIAESKKKR